MTRLGLIKDAFDVDWIADEISPAKRINLIKL